MVRLGHDVLLIFISVFLCRVHLSWVPLSRWWHHTIVVPVLFRGCGRDYMGSDDLLGCHGSVMVRILFETTLFTALLWLWFIEKWGQVKFCDDPTRGDWLEIIVTFRSGYHSTNRRVIYLLYALTTQTIDLTFFIDSGWDTCVKVQRLLLIIFATIVKHLQECEVCLCCLIEARGDLTKQKFYASWGASSRVIRLKKVVILTCFNRQSAKMVNLTVKYASPLLKEVSMRERLVPSDRISHLLKLSKHLSFNRVDGANFTTFIRSVLWWAAIFLLKSLAFKSCLLRGHLLLPLAI